MSDAPANQYPTYSQHPPPRGTYLRVKQYFFSRRKTLEAVLARGGLGAGGLGGRAAGGLLVQAEAARPVVVVVLPLPVVRPHAQGFQFLLGVPRAQDFCNRREKDGDLGEGKERKWKGDPKHIPPGVK